MPRPIARRACLAGFAAVSFGVSQSRAAEPMRVVASFSILADFVRLAGGQRVAVTGLVGPEADVHEFEPTPAHARLVADAPVLVTNGLGLEPWMARLAQAAGFKGRAIVAAAVVRPRRLGAAVDPHVWQDVANARQLLATIRDGLIAADPAGEDAYRTATATALARFDTLDAEIRAALAPIPRERRIIVTTHDAFGYFGAAYGVEFLAPLGLSSEAEPSPKQLGALARQIRARHVRALFLEKLGNSALIRQLAQETGVRVGGEVYSDALSRADGPAATYEAMMRHNLVQFVNALA